MPVTEPADPEAEGTLEQQEESDETQQTDDTGQSTDSTGKTPLEDVEGDEPTKSELAEENLPDYADQVPDHMITDEGQVDQRELYKSYQGLVQEVPDADIEAEDVINEDGTINTEELVNQRTKLRKKLSEKEDGDTESDQKPQNEDQPDSPEDYTLELQDQTIEGQTDDPLIESLRQSAFNAGMSEEQLNNFIETYEDEAGQLYGEPNSEKILSELSDDPDQAKKIARETRKWLDSKKNTGLLSSEEHAEAIEYVAQTPEGISLLNKLRQIDSQQPIPTESQASMGESLQEVEKEIHETMNQEGYTDPGHPDHERLVSKMDQLQKKKLQLQNQS